MQLKQPAYFIEQIKKKDGSVSHSSHYRIQNLQWSLQMNKNIGIETIAIFKIYPHPKPAIAHYDYDLKTTIVE